MGKTVFGIPGVNEKSEGGNPVAPKGTTGEVAAKNPNSEADKNLNPTNNTAPVSKQESKPAPAGMAQPKPASESFNKGGDAPIKSTASKTVFGMPAMKLPQAVLDAQKAKPAAPEKQPVENTNPVDSNVEQKGEDEAFMKTMIGSPVMNKDEVDKAVEDAKKKAAEKDEAVQAEEPVSAVNTSVSKEDSALDDVSGSELASSTSNMTVAIILGVAVIILGSIGYIAWKLLFN